MTDSDPTARMLTWSELEAGEPCRACGRPWIDGQTWADKGSMHFTEEQTQLYEAEEARFRAEHGECGGVRLSKRGSLTMHCGTCCPPPPFSPQKLEVLARLFTDAGGAR